MDDYENYDSGKLLKNRYKKLADISEGSYGLVSVAKDTKKDDRLVAVKFIYPVDYKRERKDDNDNRASSSPANLKTPPNIGGPTKKNNNSILKALYDEADKEIKIHKILGVHPNIASLYDHFDSCLVLEYCSRGDLYEAIQNGKGPATSQDIKDVFQQILSALDFCHSHSVFHRDLKPENILITEDWSIKLCDWGLATTTKKITNKSEFDIGSERYMAPELFDNNLEFYDASKIDLWSVGIILLTLVFHKNPFKVANYSDKRFMQFVNNREILFDIFSTMSGGLFSILRFCLNLDPNNRDISSLKTELDNVKYFTIDEEYWASEYEEDDNENENEEDFDFEDDYFYKKGVTSPSESPNHTPQIIASNYEESAGDISSNRESSNSATESDALQSSLYKNDNEDDKDYLIPHNHRADALLSSNTELKPIPIGSNSKFIRNTRKPFNVASYAQSANQYNTKYSSSRFNREDFFTPKSVFNHYMDKYGEQREQKHGAFQRGGQNQEWQKKRKYHRSWKKSKNYHGNSGNSKSKAKYGGQSRNFNNPESSSHLNHHHHHRRKSYLFSTSKSRKNGTHNQAVFSNFSLQAPTNASSLPPHSQSSAGKYIPPFLRSPNYSKSPAVEALAEDINEISLDDIDDELFHLEDDYEISASNNNSHNNNNSSQTHSSLSIGYTPNTILAPSSTSSNGDTNLNSKRPNFKIPSYNLPNNDQTRSNNPHANSSSYSRYIKRDTQRWPNSAGMEDLDQSTKFSSNNGKYIPPFRRGSHSAVLSGSVNLKQLNTCEKKKVDDSRIHGLHKQSSHLEQLEKITSSSVPSEKSKWLSRKNWSDYE